MDGTTQVALVRGGRRREAVAEALALIAGGLRERLAVAPAAVLLPDLEVRSPRWAGTHSDTLSAVVDAAWAAGAVSLEVAAAVPQALRRFRAQGYQGELWNRGVTFRGLLESPAAWETIVPLAPGAAPIPFRLPASLLSDCCRISFAVPRTHGRWRLALGLTRLGGLVHPQDRRRLEPELLGAFPQVVGWQLAGRAWEHLRGPLQRSWLGLRSLPGAARPTRIERQHLEGIRRAADRLIALASLLLPQVSIVDGFTAMHGQGPHFGSPLKLGLVVAGTDPVAVDAVAAWVHGFDPLELPYLRQAHATGLGTADLAAIQILGDPPPELGRRVRRHSADRLLRLATGAVRTPPPVPRTNAIPGPHLRPSPSPSARQF